MLLRHSLVPCSSVHADTSTLSHLVLLLLGFLFGFVFLCFLARVWCLIVGSWKFCDFVVVYLLGLLVGSRVY